MWFVRLFDRTQKRVLLAKPPAIPSAAFAHSTAVITSPVDNSGDGVRPIAFNCLVPHWLKVSATLHHCPAVMVDELMLQVVYPDDSTQLFPLKPSSRLADAESLNSEMTSSSLLLLMEATSGGPASPDENKPQTQPQSDDAAASSSLVRHIDTRVSLHAANLKPWTGTRLEAECAPFLETVLTMSH